MEPVKLSVGKVVGHINRCGDIDGRHGGDPATMYRGAKAHRMLQAAMGEDYQKEVSLRLDTEMGGIPVTLIGRADGVIWDTAGNLTIDEIKTTALPMEVFLTQRPLHLAQAKCYAWMLLQQWKSRVESITLQLTYYHLETEALDRQRFPVTREELESFFLDLMERYGVWLRFERDWRERRDQSIRATRFPFSSYRRGQRELAVAAYRAIQQRRRLYAQAPTGIGKTLSALFPAVKAIGEGQAEKLFYLTAKTVTRTVAEDAVRLMAEGGLRLKSITLRAKEKICPQEETLCGPDTCPRARGHYDRVNDALLNLLEKNDCITPDIVSDQAGAYRVCPHELALDLTQWADLIVGDYNHVFDPTVSLGQFFTEEEGSHVFLIDEAHNLGDRVRDMYTATLKKSNFLRLKQGIKDKNKPSAALRKALGQVNAYLLDVRRGLGEKTTQVVHEREAAPEGEETPLPEQDSKVLAALVGFFTAAAEEWLAVERNHGHSRHGELLELYFDALAFLTICELYDERFVTIVEVEGSEVMYTLYCLDPSHIIGEKLRLARSAILFSATLTPLGYYREMLGGDPDDRALALPSPFPEERLLLAAHCGISTRYAHREDSVAPLVETIYRAVSRRRGNYLVFFPSHAYMARVHGAFREAYPQVETLLQEGSMDEGARAAFLARFDGEKPATLVGFCVLGGIFSEGIDLKGERLIGAVVVGVGLPGLSLRQDLIRDYFTAKNGRGYDYAYVYPGMNKVLQAAGRVIRSEEDYGLVLLVDDRFDTRQYRELFPAHWRGMRTVRGTGELEGLVKDFFGALPATGILQQLQE